MTMTTAVICADGIMRVYAAPAASEEGRWCLARPALHPVRDNFEFHVLPQEPGVQCAAWAGSLIDFTRTCLSRGIARAEAMSATKRMIDIVIAADVCGVLELAAEQSDDWTSISIAMRCANRAHKLGIIEHATWRAIVVPGFDDVGRPVP